MSEALHGKVDFVNWFLANHSLKKPETAEVLKLIVSEPSLIQRVKFVENVSKLSNALLVSAEGSVTVSYLCRINGRYYEDIAEILAELINHPPEELYIWLSFDKEIICSVCHEEIMSSEEFLDRCERKFVKELEEELNRLMYDNEGKRIKLLREIDQALDQGDRGKFMYLSSLFKELCN